MQDGGGEDALRDTPDLWIFFKGYTHERNKKLLGFSDFRGWEKIISVIFLIGWTPHISTPIYFFFSPKYDDIFDQKRVLIILSTPKIPFHFIFFLQNGYQGVKFFGIL